MTRRYLALFVCVFTAAFMLTACTKDEEIPANTQESENVITEDESKDDAEQSVNETAEDKTEVDESDDGFEEFVSSGKALNPGKLKKRIGEKASDTEDMFEEKPYVYIENPSWDFYNAPELENKIALLGKEKENVNFYELRELEKSKNGIIDTYNWFEKVKIAPIEQATMHDNTYDYELVIEEDATDVHLSHILKAYDGLSGEEAFTLNFDQFVDNYEYHELGWPYTEQHIFWAQCADDILYVSLGHSTYASSCPYTAYLVAIDLSDNFKVLWKSAPLVSNSDNFIVYDDVIFTGYGFTNEDDMIYELNRYTGEVYKKWHVDSAPDFFIDKDCILYVRTYDTDYAFEVG